LRRLNTTSNVDIGTKHTILSLESALTHPRNTSKKNLQDLDRENSKTIVPLLFIAYLERLVGTRLGSESDFDLTVKPVQNADSGLHEEHHGFFLYKLHLNPKHLATDLFGCLRMNQELSLQNELLKAQQKVLEEKIQECMVSTAVMDYCRNEDYDDSSLVNVVLVGGQDAIGASVKTLEPTTTTVDSIKASSNSPLPAESAGTTKDNARDQITSQVSCSEVPTMNFPVAATATASVVLPRDFPTTNFMTTHNELQCFGCLEQQGPPQHSTGISYCHTHGFGLKHDSKSCKNRGPGHRCDATAENTLGGNLSVFHGYPTKRGQKEKRWNSNRHNGSQKPVWRK
jgi:hypothetical protein